MVWPGDSWNYLRIRGEEDQNLLLAARHQELPPHTRRRDNRAGAIASTNGITSASAEKSAGIYLDAHRARNYLRIRGEELTNRDSES